MAKKLKDKLEEHRTSFIRKHLMPKVLAKRVRVRYTAALLFGALGTSKGTQGTM